MKKIAIVMTYFDRQFQLNKTLASISKSSHKDFEIIIVDDNSPLDIAIGNYSFPITVIKIKNKKWTNPEPAYNKGIKEAITRGAEIIILQNAECYHEGDILNYADSVTNENYISFSCYSLNQETTFSNHNINEVINSNNKGAIENGENAWYNHPIHRPVAYDFCSAIRTENLIKLNGYDERFSDGCAYGDDYLIARIKMMGLRIDIPENPFVVHQWHYTTPQEPNRAELLKRNSDLLQNLIPLNEIKAQHIYTPDL
jgi:glycosyltransferase involved in cell wall biosynthesis